MSSPARTLCQWLTASRISARCNCVASSLTQWIRFVMIHGKRHVVPAPAVARPDPISFDNLSVMTWSDEKETMVVTFNERGTRTHRETVLRQYWERDAKKWKIVAEGTVR